jgi:RNA polymerase sigma-70 factor (ECF subfamily)
VAQDVLLTLARQAPRFAYDPSRRFRGLLRRLTHAAWCDWVERQRPRHHGSGDSAVIRVLESIDAPEGLADRLGREFDQEQLGAAMERVRARLETRTWEAFRLLALEGLPGSEAAARLGMRLGSAHAARCKVQRLIRLELEVAAIDD